MEETRTVDSKYIQQHLANERTYLAWIRTGIAIVGLGFVAAGVMFRASPYQHIGHVIAAFVGIGAVALGALIMACATRDYLKKQKGINSETFRSPKLSVWVTFASLGLVDMFLLALVIVLLLF
ncbi:YidH family protein [Marinicrinis lubricantis]|uniref:YidH family protein n=1 Tax=Marinicrinis lubricantis TaxID=2086470 RepID=A0ABW1ISY5_9BACL